jgi:Flp pilus assembly protein TadG
MPPAHRLRAAGQAAVEVVVLLPLLVVGLFGCWQAVLAGHAAWSAAAAARAAARAHAIGADELAAARRALPASLDSSVSFEADDAAGRVAVHIRIPGVLPGLDLGSVTSRSAFASQR